MTNGEQAKPATLQELFHQRPALRALYDAELGGEGLLDLRPQLAAAKVLAMHFVETAQLDDTDNSSGKTPPALAAIDALNRVMDTAERLLKIEERLGPITHADLKRYVHAVAAAIVRFVPAEHIAACKAFIRARLMVADGGDDRGPAAFEGDRGEESR